jgi:N-acetyltransferase
MSHIIVKTQTKSYGTIRDTVIYSLRSDEWAEAKAQLLYQLDKPRG